MPLYGDSKVHLPAHTFNSTRCKSLSDNRSCGPYTIVRGNDRHRGKSKESVNGEMMPLFSPCSLSVLCLCTIVLEL